MPNEIIELISNIFKAYGSQILTYYDIAISTKKYVYDDIKFTLKTNIITSPSKSVQSPLRYFLEFKINVIYDNNHIISIKSTDKYAREDVEKLLTLIDKEKLKLYLQNILFDLALN